jgi:hypothetical protein
MVLGPVGTLVGRGFVRIDADTKPAEKAIKALSSVGSLGALGALGGMLAPITTATLGLAGALATAGGAATAFGAAVVPQFQSITKATQQKSTADGQQTKAQLAVTAAQKLAKEGGFKYGEQVKITSKMSTQAKANAQEYNRALASAQTATKGAAKSQALYKEQLAAMPPATRETSLALDKLKDAGKKWSDSLASSTMPIFTKGIQFLQSLLPKLTPMVRSVAGEITFFLDTMGESSAGKIFKEFGRNIRENGSGALGSFLHIVTNVLAGVIGLLNAFMPASKGVTGGLEAMTKKFADWSAGLGKSKTFQNFLGRMRTEIPKLFTALGQLVEIFGKLTVAAGPFAGLTLKIAEAMIRLIDSIPMSVLKVLVPTIIAVNLAMKVWALYSALAAGATWLFSTAVTTNTGVQYANRLSMVAGYIAMGIFRAALIAQRIAMGIATAAQWLWNAAMSANPIGIVILAITALVAAIVFIALKTTWFQTIWKYTWGFIKAVGLAIGHWFSGPFVRFFTEMIPNAFKFLLDWVKGHWPWILGALTGPIGLAAAYIYTHWGQVRDFFAKAWGAIKRNAIDPIIHFFSVSIPNAGRTMRDAILGFVRIMVLGVLDSFGMIIHGAAKLFGWVPGVGGKLKQASKAFDTFRNDVNEALKGIKDRHPTVSVGMKIMSGKNAGLVNIGGIARATGGRIDGPGTETSDSILMWGSKDEHMLSAKEVRGLGGHKAVEAMRANARAGLYGYAQGGEVGVRTGAPSARQINSGVGTGFGNLMKENVWALIKAFKESMAASVPSFVGLGGKVSGSAASAMRYAQNLLNAHIYGWTMSQWPSLRSLWMGESGWNYRAYNASSGATGIPQSLPGSKMASAGADWRTNPATQIRWGMSYIHSRYGTPAHAWSSWLARSPHWYDTGGWLPPGLSMAYNGTGRPERIPDPRSSGGGGAQIAQVVIDNHGVIGSRYEVENWLVSTFEQLQRQGRIRIITRPGT